MHHFIFLRHKNIKITNKYLNVEVKLIRKLSRSVMIKYTNGLLHSGDKEMNQRAFSKPENVFRSVSDSLDFSFLIRFLCVFKVLMKSFTEFYIIFIDKTQILKMYIFCTFTFHISTYLLYTVSAYTLYKCSCESVCALFIDYLKKILIFKRETT